MPSKSYLLSVAFSFFSALTFAAPPTRAAEPLILNVWPATPPGDTASLPPEVDRTKPTDRLIAGRRIVKLGNVSTPQLAVYRPAEAHDNGAAVIICPGGGFNILAYDLEGTEVADWLNSLGFTAIVLKMASPSKTRSSLPQSTENWAPRPNSTSTMRVGTATECARSPPCRSPHGPNARKNGWLDGVC